jgi:DNA ligase-1
MNALPPNVTGFLMSEKLDGCRCVLEDGVLLSRHGRRFKAPPSFMAGMPKNIRLDGELWMGRNTFDQLVSSIQRRKSDWAGVRYMVFDLARLNVPIEQRHAALERLTLPAWVEVLKHRPCLSQDDLDATEAQVVGMGGEGLCIRPPASFYTPSCFVKVKRLHPDLNRSQLD